MKTTSSKERNGVDVKYSPVDDCSHIQASEIQLPAVKESENLIICDSQLATSFQEVKVKTRMKPGHYLQKVFLHKLKSQSVPILDNEIDSNSDNNEDSTCPSIEELNEVPKESNDNWFKTWPDCSLRNGLVTCSDDNKSASDKDKKTRICNCNSTLGDQCTNPNTSIPLDNALHSLPLAYSPVTKQIHLISQNESKNIKADDKCNGVSALNRVATEVSSFSSTVSSLSDISPSTNGDSTVGSLFDNGDSCSLVSIGNCSIRSEDSYGSKPKRKGISSFFTRSVFGWKGKNESEGWSLFSKSVTDTISRPSSGLSEERHSTGGDSGHGVLGSTGLIQLERPAWLPAKSKQEQLAHFNQHNRIISSARKREVKEAKQRKKLLQNQLKAEDELANATKVWTQEILPKWQQMKSQKRTQELWWQGIPPCVRGKLWRLAIPNDLNITHDLYEICVSRALERLKSSAGSTDSLDEPSKDADREASMELIQLDISRTFPHLCIFQKTGPYYDMLHSLLAAYVCYRPDVGYVQGMSFIAAVLILNMDAPDAFVCFANLLNRPCHRAFYSLDQPLMEAYYVTYKALLKENLPKLCEHLEHCRLTPDLYLLDWVYTIYAKAMSLDLASRIWDVFLRDGDEFLFRTAIGVLKLSQEELLSMDFVNGSQYLTKLPEYLNATQLFKSIASVRMNIGKADFSQLLASYTQTIS